MEKISADAESERSGENQARGWMRSPIGRVLSEPLLDLVATARFLGRLNGGHVVAQLLHIADVNLVMRPLRRARARLPTRPAL
jgi:hypothetical protein